MGRTWRRQNRWQSAGRFRTRSPKRVVSRGSPRGENLGSESGRTTAPRNGGTPATVGRRAGTPGKPGNMSPRRSGDGASPSRRTTPRASRLEGLGEAGAARDRHPEKSRRGTKSQESQSVWEQTVSLARSDSSVSEVPAWAPRTGSDPSLLPVGVYGKDVGGAGRRREGARASRLVALATRLAADPTRVHEREPVPAAAWRWHAWFDRPSAPPAFGF